MSSAHFTIFIVEDDAALAGELVEMLTSLGHRVEWTTGETPFGIPFPCDLILLDLGLGTADGFEILERLATHPRCPPIAIMSGRDGRIVDAACDLAQARGLRTIGALPKPATPVAIAAMLARLAASAAPAAAGGGASSPHHFVFQAKHDLSTGAVRGYETLLRVPGVDAIETWFAELDDRQALAMTVAAADAAAGLAARIAARLPAAASQADRPGTTVAFNCPPDIFGNPEMLVALRRIVASHAVAPGLIAIELTEHRGRTAAIDLSSMASRYKLAGFEVHLDDFGTGTTSLQQLLRLPLNEVKIDRLMFHSLIEEGQGLLAEIMSFCRKNAIVTTIEGIESDAERLIACRIGADCGQGFHWGKPRLDIDGGLGG